MNDREGYGCLAGVIAGAAVFLYIVLTLNSPSPCLTLPLALGAGVVTWYLVAWLVPEYILAAMGLGVMACILYLIVLGIAQLFGISEKRTFIIGYGIGGIALLWLVILIIGDVISLIFRKRRLSFFEETATSTVTPSSATTKSAPTTPEKEWTPEDGYVVWKYVKLNSRTGWEPGWSESDLFEAIDLFMEIQWERVHNPDDSRLEVRITKKGDSPADKQAVNTEWSDEGWWRKIMDQYELYDSYYETGVREYFFHGWNEKLKTREEKEAWFRLRSKSV